MRKSATQKAVGVTVIAGTLLLAGANIASATTLPNAQPAATHAAVTSNNEQPQFLGALAKEAAHAAYDAFAGAAGAAAYAWVTTRFVEVESSSSSDSSSSSCATPAGAIYNPYASTDSQFNATSTN